MFWKERGVEVKSEQMSLEYFAEDRKLICCPDIGG